MRAALFCLLLAGCSTHAYLDDNSETYGDAVSASLLLGNEDMHGSATAINDYCAVTVKHIVKDAKNLVLTNHKGQDHKVTKSYVAEYSDLAVVCADEKLNARVVSLRKEMPDAYTPVFVVGNPLSFTEIVTAGIYQGRDMITAQIAWGNSGGGVFESQGYLIGVVSAMAVQKIDGKIYIFPHLGVMTTNRDILPFLDENKIDYSGI